MKWDEAVAAYRKAIELKPDYADAHYNLGIALYDQQKLNEAAGTFRKAVELQPDLALAYDKLGTIVRAQKKWDEALAISNKIIELRPDYAGAYFDLGNALNNLGKRPEAIAACRKAIELQPDFAEAYCNLGNFCAMPDSSWKACLHFAKDTSSAPGDRVGRFPSAPLVQGVEELVDLDTRLPAILRGELRPKDNQERMLSPTCVSDTRSCTPPPASTPTPLPRTRSWPTTCASSIATTPPAGPSSPPPARARTPRTSMTGPRPSAAAARDWLRADLILWSTHAGSNDPKSAPLCGRGFQQWQRDVDLAAVRDPEPLTKLPGRRA